MKLAHPYYFDVIEIDEGEPETIVIEKNDYFRKIVKQLAEQCDTGIGDFVLSEASTPLPMNKIVSIITDLFTDILDTKTIKTKLTQRICIECESDDGDEIIAKLNHLASEICQRSSYPLTFNMGVSLNDLIKLLDFRIDTDCMTDVETLYEYVNITHELLDKKLIIMVGLKDVLSDKEYYEFVKMIKYRKIRLLMFEHRQHRVDDIQHLYIIDEDLCVI